MKIFDWKIARAIATRRVRRNYRRWFRSQTAYEERNEIWKKHPHSSWPGLAHDLRRDAARVAELDYIIRQGG